MSPFPRRLRSFSLRTLMVLVGVVCLTGGWLAREWRFVNERKKAIGAWGEEAVILVRSADGDERNDGAEVTELGSSPPLVFYGRSRPPVPFIRLLLGDEPVAQICVPESAANVDGAMTLIRLFPEAIVSDFRSKSSTQTPLP